MTKRHVSENDTLQKIVCTFFIEAGIMVFLQRITFSYCKKLAYFEMDNRQSHKIYLLIEFIQFIVGVEIDFHFCL